jgi:cell division protein FtsI/penicillin-binding protein 2
VAGIPLAQSEVRVRLNVAPPEVRDMRRLARELRRLGVDAATMRRATDRKRKWVEIPKAFMPSDVAVVSAMPGVHPVPSVQRDYVPLDGLRRIVGRTSAEGTGQDGLELVLDSLLRGQRGSTKDLLGPRGRRYESLDAMTQPPVPGHSITLTVSYVMQDICDRALPTRRSASASPAAISWYSNRLRRDPLPGKSSRVRCKHRQSGADGALRPGSTLSRSSPAAWWRASAHAWTR